jgi:hypothetical protein
LSLLRIFITRLFGRISSLPVFSAAGMAETRVLDLALSQHPKPLPQKPQ